MIDVEISEGKYVVAVSGGVDSVVLLDILSKQKDLNLVIAHLDHGIRDDSSEDLKFVKSLSKKYKLQFEGHRVNLGANTSEAEARSARYEFLNDVLRKHKADAIITAHHQDDLIETAILNLLRGTGRKGLSSLSSSERLIRPLLKVSKKEIIDYAKKCKLDWREDSTNLDTKYLRNYVRWKIVPNISSEQKKRLLSSIENMKILNDELDEILGENLKTNSLSRRWFVSLPHDVACEVVAEWLRKHDILDFNRSTIERLVVAIKVSAPNKKIDALKNQQLVIYKESVELSSK